jgi:hypothetical protein
VRDEPVARGCGGLLQRAGFEVVHLVVAAIAAIAKARDHGSAPITGEDVARWLDLRVAAWGVLRTRRPLQSARTRPTCCEPCTNELAECRLRAGRRLASAPRMPSPTNQ